MGLIDLFKKDRLQVAWLYAAEGVLWQIHAGSHRFLVGEERDIGKKEASFFCVERRTGEVLWRNMNPGERWWIGIEAVTEEVVVFHGFATPDMPGHRSITVADLRSGRVLWSNPELKLLAVAQSSITALAESRESRKAVQIDIRTGKILKESDPELAGIQPPLAEGRAVDQGVLFPSPVSGEAELEPDVGRCLRQHVASGPWPAPVLLLDFPGVVILQISEVRPDRREEHPGVRSVIKIVDRQDGSLLYSDTLQERTSVASPQSFFVQDGLLYYVRERTTLCALILPGGQSGDRGRVE